MRRRGLVLLALAALVVACTPDTAPSGPRWVATRFAYQRDAASTTNVLGPWTSAQWFAAVRSVSPASPGASDVRLRLYPRQGSAGATLGTPQELPTASAGLPAIIGQGSLIAVVGQPLAFYREAGGTWSAAGTMPIELGYQPVAMTDRWLAVRRVPANPELPGDGEVRLYALDAGGPAVVATLASTLLPDPAWPDSLRAGFGRAVALDGDLAAVSASTLDGPGPGALRIFRATAGSWAPTQSLGGEPTTPSVFGYALAVDDGPGVDRLAVQSDFATPTVDVLADGGSGFTVEQALVGDPADPLATTPQFFGGALALDGDLLAITGDPTSVPSADPSHPRVGVGHVLIYRRGATWKREAKVRIFPSPDDAGVVSAYPYALQAAGDHVAVTVLASTDPPAGCPFPCFSIGFEAWSLDRR